MYNELNINGIPTGIPQFNSQALNACFGQAPYNAPYSPPPVSYGYAYGEPYNGYTAPAPDITINRETYRYDPLSDSWCKEVSTNKGKVKTQPLTSGFNIICKYTNKAPDGELRFVIIEYTTNGKSYTALIPKDDYIKDSFHKYLKEIFRYPGCTKGKFNALVAFLLQSVPTQDIMIFPHQGWNETETGELVFAADPQYLYIPRSLISPSVKRRKLSPLDHSPQEIIQNWLDIYGKNPSLQFIGCCRVGSLFQRFLRQAGLHVHQYLIAEPSDGLTEEQLRQMLATNDIENFPVPTLSSGEDKILAEQDMTFDGVALYTDDCFADEEKEMISGLKAITKAVRSEAINDDKGNCITAIISKNAAYAATRLASDNVIVINTDGIEVEASPERIKEATGEMDSLIISTISSHTVEVTSLINGSHNYFRGFLSENVCKESLDTMTMLFIVELFFREFLGFSMLNDDSFKSLIQTVDCKNDRVLDSCSAVERDFSAVFSEMCRSKSISPVIKHRNMTFDSDGKAFIVDGERIFIPADIVEAILAQMTATRSLDNLMKDLRQTKALDCTDGNTHPVELHDSSGAHQRLYMYDISADILDADVLYRIRNIESETFLLSEDEVPQRDFLPLLNDGNGHVAGKQICYNDAENNHFYITGQSGWGKTYLLSQLVGKCFTLGHRVVIFDSSDSFTYEALCGNLSKRFVDKNFSFHDLDKDGIPIDLLKIDRSASLPSKKKLLLGILQAGIGELRPPQSNMLRMVLSDVISELGEGESLNCESIISRLSEASEENKNQTCESLLNRFTPLFEDIEECGMAGASWGEFLKRSNKVVVIHTDSAYTESGNQLIDMMLAALYNYQHDNPQTALDVFIDEIQNQNFSKTSPIRKVMKEGRKKHMSFIGATQDYYPSNTDLGSVMGKAGTQIFLRPTPNSENIVAAELRFKKADMLRFDSMERGDIIVKGSLFSKDCRRNISVTLSGHVEDFPKIPDNYYGNVK